MCAIFGTIGKADLDLLKKISKTQIYRGPDEQNFFVSNDNLVSLGNNRLSVIDKENGKQPMLSNNNRFISVFNGCIYNFNEIKNFLKSKKINFKTNSDTEVVANSYEYFGKECFNYFDGMWSIAIYDKEKKDVILSRDYVGQKPLFYAKAKNYYIFSSQLNGVVVDKEILLNISKNNLKKYFGYSYIPSPYTIFDKIFQVEPGENLIINSRNLNCNKNKYWDFQNGPDYNFLFKKDNKEDFKKQFDNLIYEHSIADNVPAISLSGGIDSYIIMKYLKKIKTKFKSFTLGFENKSFDESIYVEKTETHNPKKIFIATEKNLKNNFIELSKLIHDPNGDSSLLPTYIINKEIKKNSNVNIGGDGGDESFFGYITFDAFYLADKIKKIFPNFLLKSFSKVVNFKKNSHDYLTFSYKIKKFLNSIHLEKKFLLPSWFSCLNAKNLSNLFEDKIVEKDLYKELDNIFSNDIDLMRSSQLYHFKYYLPMVLAKVDQASMFNSVESRAPFLSKRVINFSLDQNIEKLYKIFKKKYFLKNIFKDIIPKEILYRKKHGFAFPKEKILQDKKLIKSLIDYNILINPKFFDSKYEKFLLKKEDCSQYLWNELILNLCIQNLKKIRHFN